MNLLLLPLSMLAFLAVMAPSQSIAAAVRPATCLVTIEGMHCPACAKAVAGKLKRVPDVADAVIDVRSGFATASPVQGKEPSPRSLWEAVEAGGYGPTRIEGPSGTFTSQPNR